MNTSFHHRIEQRHTWCSPDGITKNQIDFITLRRRDRKECKDARILKSADCGTDHHLVWAKIEGCAWSKTLRKRKPHKLQLANLRTKEGVANFEAELKIMMSAKQLNWPDFSQAVVATASEPCPKEQQPNKPWIDSECWELIEERRSAKKEHFQGERYRELCKAVTKCCRRAKRKWLQEKAEEAEQAHKKGNSRQVFKLVKQISGQKSTQPGMGIKSMTGEMIYDLDKILDRWYEYGKQLYSKDSLNVRATTNDKPNEQEPEVLLSEIRQAIKRLKNNKAPGLDNIPAELLKAGGETTVMSLKAIIDQIWETGEWPDDWVMSELITLPKVTGTFECDKHRTISLISHAAKIALEVIRLRVNHFIAPQIAEEQFGLVSGKGTTDAIIVLRNIIEKAVKRKGAKLWILVVDYAKAFDTVNRNALWNTLREFCVPQHLIWLMQKLYSKATGVLRIAGEHTDQFPFEKGVRQGCVLSPMLFNTCGEMIMRILESEIPERAGCIIGGRSVWNLRYADDTTLIARSCNELQQQVSAIENISAQFGLTINATKTHMMVIDAESDADQVITIAGKAIGRVERFKFLGSIVTNDSNSSTEINVRLAIARQVMRQLTEVWKSAEISLKLKKQLVKSLVWSIALYGSESWAVKKCDEKRITAFELWCWRRVLRISWTEYKTNVWVRQKIGVPEQNGLLEQLKKRKLAKYGHWKRRSDGLVMAVTEG